jgi:hypothetical protein
MGKVVAEWNQQLVVAVELRPALGHLNEVVDDL